MEFDHLYLIWFSSNSSLHFGVKNYDLKDTEVIQSEETLGGRDWGCLPWVLKQKKQQYLWWI